MPIRLVIAEDHLLVREGIRRLLETDPDIEVAADRRDLELRVGFEQPPDAFAHEEMILGDHQPERHGARIRL